MSSPAGTSRGLLSRRVFTDISPASWEHPADRSHPFHTLRAAELNRWGSSPEYAKILAGDYRRRSEDQPGSYGSDLNEAASYYAGAALEGAREVKDMAVNIAQETTNYAKRAATEASEAARQAVDRLGEVLGRRRD